LDGVITPETFVCLVDNEKKVQKIHKAFILIVDRSTLGCPNTYELMLRGQIVKNQELESIRTNSILVYLEDENSECGGVFITKSGSRYEIVSFASFGGDASGNMSVFEEGHGSCWVHIKRDTKKGFEVDVDLSNLRFPVGDGFLDVIHVIDTLYYVVKQEDAASHILYCSASGCNDNKKFSALTKYCTG
jgi:hypothetical protein